MFFIVTFIFFYLSISSLIFFKLAAFLFSIYCFFSFSYTFSRDRFYFFRLASSVKNYSLVLDFTSLLDASEILPPKSYKLSLFLSTFVMFRGIYSLCYLTLSLESIFILSYSLINLSSINYNAIIYFSVCLDSYRSSESEQ